MLKNLLLHFKTLADYIAKRDDTKNYGIPSDSITFVDESRRINTFNTDYYCGTSQLGSMAYKSSLQFSEVTSKPESLSGYGITDGVNGVSVSGSGNAVTSASVNGHKLTLTKGTTFLTSHQSVSNKGATLSWGAAVTIATIGNTNINVSLPANPNTDTKNTAGSTDTSSKIFLIGATSQSASPQTYSHDTAYVGTDGCLYSGGKKVLTDHQNISDYVNGITVEGTGNVVTSVSKSGNTISFTKGITALTAHQSVSLESGTNNGTLKLTVNGTATDNIAVKGLGSAAYTSASAYAAASHTHNYLPLSGGTMTGAINLSNTNAKLAFGSLTTSPITGYKAPALLTNGVGIYSRYGGNSDEGAIIITEDTCVIYNSADTGWNFQVMDKDLGTDLTNDATRSFGVNQAHQAWSLAGFVKSGSSDSYVLLGGGGHKALSDFSMAHSHPYLPLSGGALTGSVSLKETCNILLRPSHDGYTSGIGYDTNGNECVAIWAKNTVTRLRWHAGVDMSTLTSGTMMGITPDFEISKASGSAVGYIAGQTIIHSGNYNSYAPTKTGGGASGTWGISITGNAASATSSTKATQDSAGQQINTTYIKSLSVSGTTITYTKGDGTTGTITTQDTNTDTKNTAGTTNLTATKLYLAGATSQTANPQTYSNANVYIGTDNCLYSGGVKVLTNHQAIYDLTIQGNGTTIGTFDPNGAAKTINITPANIGAAASSHTHSQYATGIDIGDGAGRPASGGMLTIPAYVPKSGGTFTGDVNVPYLTSDDGIESGGNVQATGFKVEGSSDANIVLAGGGTKAVSYFATAGHTHSYLPISGGTLTGNLTCNKDLYSNYLKSVDGSSNINIGDSDNSAYVTFVEDMQGSNDYGDGTWYITNSGDATFNNVKTATMQVDTSLEAKKIFTDNIKTSASGLKVQKSDYVATYVQIGPSGQIELSASTPIIDFHYNNSTSDYSTRIVCDTSSRLSVLATTLRASNAITCVSLTQTSDERLKDNIKDIDDEFINKLFDTDNGFIHQFDFKESGKHSNGIIAQEVKDIMPEVVDYDETDDVYRVDYTSASMKLIGAMFKKMKQMQEEIDALKLQNNKN